MHLAPFTLYRVENTITEESAAEGDYASSEASPEAPADLRSALDELLGDCWDSIDARGDGTIIAYPADYEMDIRTGEYSAEELIIHARRPEWADRLLNLYEARK